MSTGTISKAIHVRMSESASEHCQRGGTNPLSEVEEVCAGCGEPLDGEKFKDGAGDNVCGECLAWTFRDACRGVVVYTGNGTFKYMEVE